MRKIKAKPNRKIAPCPECGNNTEFVSRSAQIAEDCCEVWVECKCGYDPTAITGDRFEDVWGGCSDANTYAALACWNDALSYNA